MTARGVVTEWNDEDGWGVIESAETPGGCWAHYSGIDVDVERSLTVGQGVAFTFEAVPWQDGYQWRAVHVRPDGARPGPPRTSVTGPSSAYRSWLIIEFDDPPGDQQV